MRLSQKRGSRGGPAREKWHNKYLRRCSLPVRGVLFSNQLFQLCRPDAWTPQWHLSPNNRQVTWQASIHRTLSRQNKLCPVQQQRRSVMDLKDLNSSQPLAESRYDYGLLLNGYIACCDICQVTSCFFSQHVSTTCWCQATKFDFCCLTYLDFFQDFSMTQWVTYSYRIPGLPGVMGILTTLTWMWRSSLWTRPADHHLTPQMEPVLGRVYGSERRGSNPPDWSR